LAYQDAIVVGNGVTEQALGAVVPAVANISFPAFSARPAAVDVCFVTIS
jgi:hypothetical protein